MLLQLKLLLLLRAGRRTYRAHGRINPYMSMPCHVELILAEKETAVKTEQVCRSSNKQDCLPACFRILLSSPLCCAGWEATQAQQAQPGH